MTTVRVVAPQRTITSANPINVYLIQHMVRNHTRMNPLYGYFVALAIAAFMLPLISHAGGEPLTEADRLRIQGTPPAWTELHYAAGNMAGTVKTSLVLTESSVRALDISPYMAFENVQFQIVPDALDMLKVHGQAKPLIGKGSESEGKIWFDPLTGAVLQRDRIRLGKKGVRKIYRFGEEGAYRVRLEPDGRNEAESAPDDWTKVKESFYPYQASVTDCRVVSDPVVILYFMSVPEFPVESRTRAHCLFFDDAVYRVQLEVVGNESLDLSYSVKGSHGESTIEGKRDVLKIALHVVPLTKGADTKNFELLELRGNITLYLDSANRIPVQIRGERGGLGDLSIPLKKAVLSDSY